MNNLHKLKEVLNLKLATGRVLLVTKGPVPVLTHERLTVANSVPDGNEPLRFALIIFVFVEKPFNTGDADKLEMWFKKTNRRIPVMRFTDAIGDVARVLTEGLAGTKQVTDPSKPIFMTRSDRATFELMLRNRGGGAQRPVSPTPPVAPAPPPPPPPARVQETPLAPVSPPAKEAESSKRPTPVGPKQKPKPTQEKKPAFRGSVHLAIAKHVEKGWSNVDAEVKRLTALINAERPPENQTNENSVRHAFMMLLCRRLIPQPQRVMPVEARHEWVHQRVHYIRANNQTEANRLRIVAHMDGYTGLTTEDMLESIEHLVQQGDIKPAREPDED